MANEPGDPDGLLRPTLQDYLKKDGVYRFEVVASIESGTIADQAKRDRLTMLRDSRDSAFTAHLDVVSQFGWP
jgi:hypothetical protein